MTVDNYALTEMDRTIANQLGLNDGVKICLELNYLLKHTFIRYYLQVGERMYPVVRVSPQPNHNIRVFMIGISSIVVPCHTQFKSYLGANIQEYASGIKETVSGDTGPI